MKGNNIFTSFLDLLKVKHTRTFSDRYFNEHPHKYNLFGLSKMLSDYGIENAATKIADKEHDIFEIETPFIAPFGGDFVPVYQVDSDKVRYIWRGKETTNAISDFLNAWSGVILLAEPAENAGEPAYKENKKKELLNAVQKYLLFFAAGLILVSGYISQSVFTNLGLNMLLILNLLGIYTGYLLVLKQFHIHSQYADKICSLFKQHDCNDILESKAAKFWGIFGWSEIGLGYFSANTIILLFLPSSICFLAIINILALPYSFWSVWYQKFRAKQWCVLCLIVQILFWLLFAVDLFAGFIQLPAFDSTAISGIAVIICIFGVCILGINWLVPKLSKGNQIEKLKQEINSMKSNESVFRVILKERPFVKIEKTDSQIIFGEPDASLQITIFSNPYCNPCAAMHKRIEKLLDNKKDKLCVRYILSAFSKELEMVNKYLIAVYLEKDKHTALQIFSDWFEKGKPLSEDFFKEMGLDMNNLEIEAEFQKHAEWKEKSQLRATPTVLVGGYQLPENYKIEDLRYFTEFNVDVK
jgi:uncharacterized membrane protein